MTKDSGRDPALLRSAPSRRWTPAVFGIVPVGARRRRPSDITRVALASFAITVTALGAHQFTTLEWRWFNLLAALPSWLRSAAGDVYEVGAIGTVVVLLLALAATRRWRLLAALSAAGILAHVLATGLRALVDLDTARTARGLTLDGNVPDYPVLVLAVCTTVILVARPYMLRPARRGVLLLLGLATAGAVIDVVGLPEDIVASLALGWGVAALFHLAAGTPAATPSMDEVAEALDALGVAVTGLELAPRQAWGTTHYAAIAPDGGAISIEVIGRDATDARLFAKLWRFVFYRDSGPTLALTRRQQLEHQAYVLLLARKAGVSVSDVIIAGIGGSRDTAVLVLREPDGVALTEVAPDRVTDAVLDDAWTNLGRLHDARLAHGRMSAANVRVRDEGTTAFVDFGHASSVVPTERGRLDDVALLATTAVIVGTQRAIPAAHRALGDVGLANALPLLEPAALPSDLRKTPAGDKELLGELRSQGAERVGVETVQLVKVRRASIGDLLIAGGTILGVYLLFGQLSQVDYATVFSEASWGWVAVAFLISPLPQLTGAVALKGSVAAPLPTGPVVAEQFANNFTGLIGGTVATTALVIRFFQKQGLNVAVAASSGVVNSLAGFIAQASLVIIGLTVVGGDFNFSRTGGRDLTRIAIIIIMVGGVAISALFAIPRLRTRARQIVEPQWRAAKDNLAGILFNPRKAAMLFGGNLASQILFAIAILATLHAFGQSLPLLQIIVINSFASFIGGAAPVPGGMGVIEAGLIAGFTAAGVPDAEAVAVTFTYRTFTAYLPPIWGWFSLNWLRRHDYV